MGTSTVAPEKDATPNFDDRCRAIVRQWEAGELPFRDASQALAELEQEAIEEHKLDGQARVQFFMGYMQGYRSNLNTSIRHFEQARELYEQIGDEKRLISCDLNLGETYRLKGDFTHAQRLFRMAYEHATRVGEITTQTVARANEGQMLVSMGKDALAREALETSLNLADEWPGERKDDLSSLLCEVYHGLAILHLREGNLKGAWEKAKRALEAARSSVKPLAIGHASRTLGEVLTALDEPPTDFDESFTTDPDDYFKTSIEAFEELDAEGEMARTLLAYARSLAKRGRRVPAARKLQQATLLFAKLGMTDDAAKAAEAQAEIF